MKVALVGRPNVGKSALFNRICGKRVAIVDEAEGTTRDGVTYTVDFFGKIFEIVDSAGFDTSSESPFVAEVSQATLKAIEEADVLIMVVDGKVGPHPLDKKLAKIVLSHNKRTVLAVNKIDNESLEGESDQFVSLGFQNIMGISAIHGIGIVELLNEAFEGLSWDSSQKENKTTTRIAIIGKPNVGKSTLLNALLKQERAIVSDVAGTTRDIIEEEISFDGEGFTLIDTAGLIRKKTQEEAVEKFSAIRTEEAIKGADICLLILDAPSGMSTQEKKIAHLIEKEGKGCLLIFNKWDLMKGCRMEHYSKALKESAPTLSHCPMLFISALSGRNLDFLVQEIVALKRRLQTSIPTAELNKFIAKAMRAYQAPMIKGKRFKILYLTQIATNPPRFLLFVNDPLLFGNGYKQYLINAFRSSFDLKGVFIDFDVKSSHKPKRAY